MIFRSPPCTRFAGTGLDHCLILQKEMDLINANYYLSLENGDKIEFKSQKKRETLILNVTVVEEIQKLKDLTFFTCS